LEVVFISNRYLVIFLVALSLPACSLNKLLSAPSRSVPTSTETESNNEANSAALQRLMLSQAIFCNDARQTEGVSHSLGQTKGRWSTLYRTRIQPVSVGEALIHFGSKCKSHSPRLSFRNNPILALHLLKLETSHFAHLQDLGLHHVATAFKQRIKVNRSLNIMRQHIYDQARHLDLVSTLTFTDMVLKRLHKYRALFEAAGDTYGLDWKWLAAMAYQESHWNPDAISPTGVQGLMMLTQVTAKELGISDRVDPRQSVDGGARYLMDLKQRLSKDIKGPDRLWIALASYNVGLGHILDARMLARKFGANPNLWREVKKYLPLLTRPKWYQQTRFGYARGYEPVKYVENIRTYYEILKWLTSKEATLILVKNEASDPPRNTL